MKKFINIPYLLIACLLTIIVAGETTFNAWAYSQIFAVIEKGNGSQIVNYVLIVMGGYLLFSIIGYIENIITNKSIKETNLKLKVEVLKKILIKGKIYYKNNVSDNLSFFLNDLKQLEEGYFLQLFKSLGYLSTIILTLTFSIQNDFMLTIIFLLFSSITPFLTTLFKKSIGKANSLYIEENKSFSSSLKDILHGITTIKNYNVENEYISQFENKSRSLEKTNEYKKNSVALSNAIITIIAYFFMYLPIGVGMFYVVRGVIPLSSFIAVQYSSSWIVNSFLGFSQSLNMMNSTVEVRKTIEDLLETKETIKTNVLEGNGIKMIEFRDVSFEYKDLKIFDKISFSANLNEKVLIQGPSGSGKTTFLKLITKELTPSTGNIYINGKNIDSISKNELMSDLVVVTQNVIIFNTTILDNLTLGKQFTEEAVLKAVHAAGLDEVVNRYGLDYLIGEEGQLLSGGQLKRIEIARAILYNKSVLLIDEGNANLDEHSATEINTMLTNLNKLIIDIEHYVPESTIKNYDQHFSVIDGTIQATRSQ